MAFGSAVFAGMRAHGRDQHTDRQTDRHTDVHARYVETCVQYNSQHKHFALRLKRAITTPTKGALRQTHWTHVRPKEISDKNCFVV